MNAIPLMASASKTAVVSFALCELFCTERGGRDKAKALSKLDERRNANCLQDISAGGHLVSPR